MSILGLFGGIAIGGVAGFFARDYIAPNTAKVSESKKQMDDLYVENERIAKRNKELERQVEDLLAEVNKAKREAKRHDDTYDEMEDSLSQLKKDNRLLLVKNEELQNTIREYKVTCETLAAQIDAMKEEMQV